MKLLNDTPFEQCKRRLDDIDYVKNFGTVDAVQGGIIHAIGLGNTVSVGDICHIADTLNVTNHSQDIIYGEVISFCKDYVKILSSVGDMGIRAGMYVMPQKQRSVAPSNAWLGCVVDAFGCVLDDLGNKKSLPKGDQDIMLKASPPNAASRRGLGERLETNTAFMNSFLPICRGQRIGLFAGSGVGKSTLLSHLARNVDVDIVVVGLIGERGREVNEFVHKTLTPKMREKCVIIAVSSDQSALLKRRGSYLTMAVAEYFRNQGKNVLLLFDSVTRFAEAQRQIALLSGEPPAMRAFPPSAFSESMALCERAGTGCQGDKGGDITAIFTVLVQGSDMEEPIADCIRGTIDGHILLDRAIAERGLYPAVDVLKSVSRSLPDCASDTENTAIKTARRILSEYKDIEPMVRLGVYKQGASPVTDKAVALYPEIEAFIYTLKPQKTDETFAALEKIVT
ncbi:MAG: flagellum-specific ATP synthase [Dasania sp.]|jgi:flagellum-specific ATP synthase